MRKSTCFLCHAGTMLLAVTLAGCGGGGSNSPRTTTPVAPPVTPPPPAVVVETQYRASAASPFAAGCDGTAALGTVYANAEVEPYLAVDPHDPNHLLAVWQQDRWSSGGARGIVSGVSQDGGRNWTRSTMPFTRCAGGNAGNGGDYQRASNAWLTFAPDGSAYQIALTFDGQALASGSVSAMLVSRSGDGGRTWGTTTTLIRDVAVAFNDKPAIVADPGDARFVYAVWDRLTVDGRGPTWFARSSDAGASWEAPRAIYDPGLNNQTIANVPAVLPNGTLVTLFTEIDSTVAGVLSTHLAVIRSSDNGSSWSAPIKVAELTSVGTRDPDTGVPIRDGSLIASLAVGPGASLAVAWQDARFSGGVHDDIALVRSLDGGLSWSNPIRVNGDGAVAAFVPTVQALSDGTIAVSYYDFRSDTSDPATLFTDYWLAHSSDGATWHEDQIAAPFDLALAPQTTSPNSGGYFLGDYQGLVSSAGVFVPLFARSNAATPDNRTDVFAAPALRVAGNAVAGMASARGAVAGPAATDAQTLRSHVHANARRVRQQRLPGRAANVSGAD